MSQPEHESDHAGPEPEAVALEPGEDPIAELREAADVEGLLTLGRERQLGQDLAAAHRAFEAAAALGSAEGEYSVALFHLSGTLVAQDVPKGVGFLRGAAGKGHQKARMYLGNIYELGLQYDADPAKADTWYRAAARAAGIEHEPGSRPWNVAMADLGCARACQALLMDDAVPKKDRIAYLKKAKPLGYGEYLRSRARRTRDEVQAAGEKLLAEAEADEAPVAVAKKVDRAKAAADEEISRPDTKVASRWTVGAGLGAFGVEALLCAAAWGAGILATAGAVTLIGAHGELPLLGRRVELLLPLAVALFGVLPSFFLYRARAVLTGALFGAATGAAGHFLFETWHAPFFPERPVQTAAFGVVGFLVALLFLGMRGGTRRKRDGDATPSAASTPSEPAPPPRGRARS